MVDLSYVLLSTPLNYCYDNLLTDTIELGRFIAVVSAVIDLIAGEIIVDAKTVVAFVIR